MKSDFDEFVQLIVGFLIPELYEDEVYVWEIVHVLRYICNEGYENPVLVDLVENDSGFVKDVTVAVVGKILTLPGIEAYFTGWPFEGDWVPRRSNLSANAIVELVRAQLAQLDREPQVLEIAFFRGVEG